MLKDVTLGQFFPGESVLHRADPRLKMILAVFYIVMLFLAGNAVSIGLMFVLSVLLIGISGIPVATILRGIKPVLFILVFTFLLNALFTTGETLLFEWWIIHIYAEGLWRAFLLASRIVLMITATSLLLSYTTSPIMLTDAIEQLFAPLKKLHLPVHEFAMMMTIALRFIPILVEETDKVMSAQKARGADFSSGGVIKKAKALIPVIVPLFASAFRRADDLAVAMECRCYRGGDGRTRMTKLSYGRVDLFLAIAALSALALLIVSNLLFSAFSF